jgi:hypothetical protein
MPPTHFPLGPFHTQRTVCRRLTASRLLHSRGALAVTQFTITTLATPRSCPTARDKIHSRAGNIAGHFHTPQTTSNSASIANMAGLPISEKGYHSAAPSAYTARKIGAPNTLEHRIFIERDGQPLSPFHDIPLFANQEHTILNMIVEVPRWTNAKMEVSRPSTSSPMSDGSEFVQCACYFSCSILTAAH